MISTPSSSSSRGRGLKQGTSSCSGVCVIICLVLSLFLFGVLISMQSVSDKNRSVDGMKSLYDFSSQRSSGYSNMVAFSDSALESAEVAWTPISISKVGSDDPVFELCQLDFKGYAKAPHLYAMFKDLVLKSNCRRRTATLSELKAEMQSGEPNGNYLEPSGFVFHESRVGSTLVANMLAADPYSMVFSESSPPTAVLQSNLPRQQKIDLFRDVLLLMGHTKYHKHLFLKFQSVTNTANDIILEAFPSTPWIFLYRQPVQTMMSHVGITSTRLQSWTGRLAKAGGAAPCLRSKRSPNELVSKAIAAFEKKGHVVTDPAWCAAHLNMLCHRAIEAMGTYGEYHNTGGTKEGEQRGMAVDYAGLPGVIPRVVLPLFGVSDISEGWLARMQETAMFYSKGSRKRTNEVFAGDSKTKDSQATDDIKIAAELILQPSYEELGELSSASIFAMKQELFGGSLSPGARIDREQLWSELSEFPKPMLKSGNKLRGSGLTEDRVSLEESRKIVNHSFEALNALSPEMELLWRSFASNHSSRPFERVHCPEYPDPDYPKEYPITDIISNWPPDSTDIPAMHYDSICRFDYQREFAIAERYRNAEKPFIVYNVPEVNEVVEKWSDADYINRRLNGAKFRSESSDSNHFMYFRSEKARKVRSYNGTLVDWSPPTKDVHINFADWLSLAVKGQAEESNEAREHVYFRVTAQNPRAPNGWLFKEIPVFQPKKNSFFVVEPTAQRGIHCRFGMRSIIAENHYDGSRNFVIELGGLRRWILSHPKNCDSMYLLQKNHPSGRHSEVDWSNPDYKLYPKFKDLLANEIIFKPGDVLYVPTSWFHYIVSLNVNYQCNTRSGRTLTYTNDLKKCGWS